MARGRIIAAIVIVCTPMLFFSPLFFTYGLGPFEDDLIQYFPNLVWLGRQIQAHQLPFWNSLAYGGYPQIGDPQSGVFYPLNWVSVFLPDAVMYPLLIIIHYWIAGLGMYRLGRTWHLSRTSTLFGALAWMFCGFMLAHRTHYTILASTSWMSVGFYLWTRIIQGRHLRQFFVAAVVVQTLQILAGHVQVAAYSGAAVFLYLLFVLESRLMQIIGLYLLSYILTFALALDQLLPVWNTFSESVRTANSYRFVTENSFFPLAWTLVIAPASLGLKVPNFLYSSDYFGPWNHCELNCFTTLAALTLGAFALRNVWRDTKYRRLVIFCIVLGLLSIFLALGRYNPAFKALFEIPIFRPFRCPARYLIWFNFVVVILAMIAMESLLSRRRLVLFRHFAIRFAATITIIFIAYLLAIRYAALSPLATKHLPEAMAKIPPMILAAIRPTNPAMFIPVLAAVAIIVLCLKVDTRRLRRFLLLLLIVEIASFAPFYDFDFSRMKKMNLYPPVARKLDELSLRTDGMIWPLSEDPYVQPLTTLQPFTNMLVDRPTITGYGPLLNRYQRRLFGWELWPTTDRYLEILTRKDMLTRYAIRYIVTEPKFAEQISQLRKAAKSTKEFPTISQSLSEHFTVDPAAPINFNIALEEGMYRLQFHCRRRTPDQLRLCVSLVGLTDKLWNRQKIRLTTWDIDDQYRRFDWYFYVPKTDRSVQLDFMTDYGACEFQKVELTRAAFSVDHLRGLRFMDKNGIRLYENMGWPGSAYFVPQAEVVAGDNFDAARLQAVERILFSSRPDLAEIVARNTLILPNRLGRGHVLKMQTRTNTIDIDASVDLGSAVLGGPGGYHRSWRAYIDGVETPLLCVDGISRGVIVPAGEHRISFLFLPDQLMIGLAVSIFTALILLTIFTSNLSPRKTEKI